MISPEFPQYPFVAARWFSPGRPAGVPRVIFWHTTEGSEGLLSAEAGASYDARRADKVSAHFMCDQDSTIQEVLTTDTAYAARAHGNPIGIQVEVCGKAAQDAKQWADAASRGAVTQFAHVAVALRSKYGRDHFPLINLTPAQLRNGAHGFAEHLDATLAWPEDGGDHTDPGRYAPWTNLFAQIQEIESNMDAVQLSAALRDYREGVGAGDALRDAIGGMPIGRSGFTAAQQWDETRKAVNGQGAALTAARTQLSALDIHVATLEAKLDKVLAVLATQAIMVTPTTGTSVTTPVTPDPAGGTTA